MNEATLELFKALRANLDWQPDALGKRIREILGPDLVSRMTPEQHKELKAELDYAIHSGIWSFLGPFNNVGCVLDGPFHGYTIVGTGKDREPEKVGDGYTDLCSLWNEFTPPPPTARMNLLFANIQEGFDVKMKAAKKNESSSS